MPKYVKQFIVFDADHYIYIYQEDTDDKFIETGEAKVFDTLGAAKKEAIKSLGKYYDEEKERIENLKVKDIK